MTLQIRNRCIKNTNPKVFKQREKGKASKIYHTFYAKIRMFSTTKSKLF